MKTRTKIEFGAPDRAVDAEKRPPLWQPRAITPRFVGVDWSRVLVSIVLGKPLAIEWIRHAFPRSGSLITAAPAVRL